MADATATKIKEDRKVIERFEKDYKEMSSFWDDLHQTHRQDTKFTWFGEQWSSGALSERKSTNINGTSTPLPPRPTNVFNISKPFIVRVINGVKKMDPNLVVTPIDEDTDVKLAGVQRGVMLYIQRNGGADAARMQALKDAVTSGYGFYGLETDWLDPLSQNQEIKYRVIEDATTVLWDDGEKKPDGSSLKKIQIRERYSKDNFEAEFKMDWEEAFEAEGTDTSEAWGTLDKPVVTEYWYIEEKPDHAVKIDVKKVIPLGILSEDLDEFLNQLPTEVLESDGSNMFLSQLKEALKDTDYEPEEFIAQDEEGEYIQRETNTRQVWRCKMAGKKVLNKVAWDGYYIPFFKVEGRSTICEGKVKKEGLSRDTRASQKCYNYARNNKLERLALSPKVPWIYAEGSLSSKEKFKMDTANTRNWPSIGVKTTDEKGQPYFQPYRPQVINIDPGLTQEEMTAAEEMKSALGMFGSYMGDTTGEKSGRAIMAGAAESGEITMDFAYNLGLTMQHEGRVLSELIPKVHDVAQQVRMVGEDDKEKVVWVNQKAQDERGKDYYYDLAAGKFDIHVTMGKSSETKRLETREEMEALFGKTPELREILSDIWIKTHDWDNADEASQRARDFIKMKYPGLVKGDDEEQGPSPAEMQMREQMKEMNEVLQQTLKENESLKADKSLEAKKIQNDDMNNEERNEIDTYNSETNRLKVENDNNVQNAKIMNDRIKLQAELRKAEMDYKIKLAGLKEQRDARMVDPNANQHETMMNFEAAINDLNSKLAAIQNDVSQRQQELPEINVNIENKLPGKQNSNIIKTPGGFKVINEDVTGENSKDDE